MYIWVFMISGVQDPDPDRVICTPDGVYIYIYIYEPDIHETPHSRVWRLILQVVRVRVRVRWLGLGLGLG